MGQRGQFTGRRDAGPWARRDAGPWARHTHKREVALMHAVVGDRLHVHGKIVGQTDRMGKILEVHGTSGGPPYLVRFEDGHESLVFPGPDAVIEHPASGRAASK
jgi:hypothetical protein